MKHRLSISLYAAIALAVAVFTGSAVAGGNGHGGGSQSQPATLSAAAPAPTPTTSDNSTGVKPSNSTKKDTHEQASSSKTKQYGNGKTAGQIATKAGYGNATLHGPGNSQPHKTTACGGRHEVDVHALKNKGSKCAAADQGSVKATEHSPNTDKQKTKTDEQKKSESSPDSAHLHVTICHATGSESNPYVMISPSASGVVHGHLGHQDGRDIVPPFTYKGKSYSENWSVSGQAIYNAGCTIAQSQSSQSSQSTQATPLSPAGTQAAAAGTAATSATGTAATQAAATSAPAATPLQAGGVLGAQAALTPAAKPTTAAKPMTAGGVLGAQVALKSTTKPKANGILGATARLGHTVAATHLPFTGLPLWIFAAIAAALIFAGAIVRRSANDRV